MGKELFFVRHSLARVAHRGQSDIDRLLSDSGTVRAMQLGNYLKSSGFTADVILCSEALRARATAELIAEQLLEAPYEIVYHQDIYESSVRLMVALIHELDDKWEKVMIVGHNPIIPYTVEYLSNAIVDEVEPAGMLSLQSDADSWSEIKEKSMEMKGYLAPSVYVPNE